MAASLNLNDNVVQIAKIGKELVGFCKYRRAYMLSVWQP